MASVSRALRRIKYDLDAHLPVDAASSLPHGQLGLNALATGVLRRVAHRLPFRQVTRVFADLPGLSVSPGAITKQVQRIADWLSGDYEQLVLKLRASKHVYADETGWRTNGQSGFLWTLATPDQTLLHVDKSRGGKVIRQLLGETFEGTLVSDFYSAYATTNCPKQKCLAHLLRELAESAEESQAFAEGVFFPRAKKLVKQMLKLKGQWDELTDDAYTTKVCRVETQLEQLSGTLRVREIRYTLQANGRRTRVVTIVTTLLDPALYPKQAIIELYGLRWNVETNFGHLKTTLKMRRIKCKTADGVRKELLVYALVYNLVRAVMLESARRQQVPEGRISFIDALRWLRSADPDAAVPDLVVNPRRPDRHEPRVVKDFDKGYRKMTKPRNELRKLMKKGVFLTK